MSTIEFKTKSQILDKKMPRIVGNNQHKGKYIIALDGGYSSLKGVSPDRIFQIPAYAKRIDKELESVGTVKNTDIQYRNNNTGEIWIVGETAQELMNNSDLESTTDASIYTRYRYHSDIYKVIMSTGLALGCIGGGDNEIYLQTGLPAEYKERDEPKLVNALAGDYNISIKVGTNKWLDFKFSLPKEHIFVMEQPQGTLCGCTYGPNGITKQGIEILKSNAVVLDIGFGTEDTFSIRTGYRDKNPETYTDTGMKSVFETMLNALKKDYADSLIDAKVFELQNYLSTGQLPVFDPDTIEIRQIDFSSYLMRANKNLCEKSIKRLMQDYDNLLKYKYLIITGGTGESRFEQIKEMLKGITTLTVLPGNINYPDLPFSYCNVMGYYSFRHAKFMAELKKEDSDN